MKSEEIKTPTGCDNKYIEFYIDNYYLKIALNNNEIVFIIYNIKLLNSVKYEIKTNKNEIYNLSKIFRIYENIEEIYEVFIQIIKEKNYKIEEINNDIRIIFEISDIFKKNKEIELILKSEDDKNEYLKILSKEIINIKDNEIKKLIEENKEIKEEIQNLKNMIKNIQNNEKNEKIDEKESKNNVKEINQNNNEIKNKEKQNIINKNDNKINIESDSVNENNEDNILKKFNEIFGEYIKNAETIESLDINFLDNGNDKIKYLDLVEFKQLKKLNINNSHIKDIIILEKVKFNQIQQLNLGENNIFNIDILEKVNFPKLIVLKLHSNQIYNISVLEKVKFNQL